MSDTPIADAEFERLLQLFLPLGKKVAVAVSGGADSMALAACLGRLLGNDVSFKNCVIPAQAGIQSQKKPSSPPSPLDPGLRRDDDKGQEQSLLPLALIVEHGLRPESAAEAQTVSARLNAMGIETEILPWQHGPIETRIHVRARQARYALLIEACKKHDVQTLFLAHHADDQAETVLMRLAKGSGVDGLAGMAPLVVMDGVRLVRPFLSIPKARLVATCAALGLETVIDPSNEKEKYARGRLRRVLPLLEAEGLTPSRLVDLASRAREAKEALDHYAHTYLRDHALVDVSGAVTLDVAALSALPAAVALRVLAACLSYVHKTDYPPEREALVSFMAWVLGGQGASRTLHGCLIQKNEAKQTAVLMREAAGIMETCPIAPGETALWDGRWRVTLLPEAESGLSLRALGEQNHAVLDALAPHLRRLVSSGRRRASLPALWRGDTLTAIPSLGQGNQVVARAALVLPFWAKESL